MYFFIFASYELLHFQTESKYKGTGNLNYEFFWKVWKFQPVVCTRSWHSFNHNLDRFYTASSSWRTNFFRVTHFLHLTSGMWLSSDVRRGSRKFQVSTKLSKHWNMRQCYEYIANVALKKITFKLSYHLDDFSRR